MCRLSASEALAVEASSIGSAVEVEERVLKMVLLSCHSTLPEKLQRPHTKDLESCLSKTQNHLRIHLDHVTDLPFLDCCEHF